MDGNGKSDESAPAPPVIVGPTLIVQMDPLTGNVSVEGPADDETLCMRMLAKAMVAIVNHNVRKQANGGLVLASTIPPKQ